MLRAVILFALAATGLGIQVKTQTEAQADASQLAPAVPFINYAQPHNVLLGAHAMQSSTAYNPHGIANHATDGGKQCRWVWSGNSVTHTNGEVNPWWNADMGRLRNIKQIRTYNRADCCQNRLTDYQVRIGHSPDVWLNPACPGTFTDSQVINCNLSGRYLGITLPGKGKILSLCEVEAFESIPYTQLKAVSATQSSTAYGTTGAAKYAIDGSKECSFNFHGGPNSVTHTNLDKNAWWSADLGAVKTVTGVTTYNRQDCCQNRLANYEVRVGNDANPLNNPACPGIHFGGKNIECSLQGRYVAVVLLSTDYLSLCEVEIFGF